MKATHERDLKRLLDEAFRAFESGDDETARKLCREALALDPDSSTAHSLMGLLYEREGRGEAATGEFAKVVSINPSSDAERHTLRRLRGDVLGEAPPPADQSNRTVVALAALAAVVVLAAVSLGIYGVSRWIHDRSTNNVYVASANLDEDLDLAKEAFREGRYEVAMEASGRVLRVDPDHDVAQEIYTRSKAFLDGTAQPPAPQPAQPPVVTQPAPVRSEPAIPAPSTGAPAVAAAPAPAPGSAAGRSYQPYRGPVSPTPAGRGLAPAIPSVSAPTAPARPGLPTSVRPTPRPMVGYDPTAAARARTQARSTVRTPTTGPTRYEEIAPPDPRTRNTATTIGGSEAPAPKKDGYVKVEVRPREPQDPDQPAPEVTPDLKNTPPAGTAAQSGGPANPEVEAWQERQKRLEQAKARARAAASRRAEQEQGR